MGNTKRLIEVDLPIRRISVHARREKSIRHGHISTLHIWWARRPLAACRAVICAALWPDPVDDNCPQAFRDAATTLINGFAKKADGDLKLLANSSEESKKRWAALAKKPLDADKKKDLAVLRAALLDFIADFANWDNSTVKEYLETSRALTQAAHEVLGGTPSTRPLVADPFAGGGSIPLEALRVGADAFASDLNPVSVLLNRVMLEYIPKYGQKLADEVRKWGKWIKKEAEKELAEFYPKDADGATPIAYLWARTVQCEGPGCGAEVPLIRSLWLAKKANRAVALELVPNKKAKRVDFQIIVKQHDGWVDYSNLKNKIESPTFDGTVKRGSVTCPCCGYTTTATQMRSQLRARRGGTKDARLICVVTTHDDASGRFYRLPTKTDYSVLQNVQNELNRQEAATTDPLAKVPNEPTPEGKGKGAGRAFSQRHYGMETFADVYTDRQALTLTTLARIIRESHNTSKIPQPVRILCAFALGRVNDLSMSLCRWLTSLEAIAAANGGQNRMPVSLDYVESNPFGGSGGDWLGQIDWIARVVEHLQSSALSPGNAARSPAQYPCLPEDSADAIITDPPYYDAFPYSDLSDFFFIWLKRALGAEVLDYTGCLVPKDEEAVVYDVVHGGPEVKDRKFFQREMTRAFTSWRSVTKPSGIGVVVFANKTTEGWESLIQSIIDAGWIATASWPIDTERPNRQRAIDSAALGSSVHVVCRPRENPDGSIRTDEVGDWRDVLSELPRRIHQWMPRLAEEGVVGADAIFACLGPALEIFSRYSSVEKASGEQVLLKEYLECVWAAVSHEALSMIFDGVETTALEEDARLTAMWLWTLSTGGNGSSEAASESDEEDEDEEESSAKSSASSGYILEYDAARKIAQGLGAHLEQLTSIIEVKGDKARLLSVAERTKHLFGKDEGAAPAKRKKKKSAQKTFFDALDEAEQEEGGWGEKSIPALGNTVLDRIHQSMILFAAGRSEALKRFLVEDGIGRDARFWRLAQSLSALYPPATDEKRWVDGVLARKKGLGF
jgi:adenine-specific DNA methylase